MSKGADSIMLPRCVFESPESKVLLEKTNKDLYFFAVEGLRTLVMGKRKLSKQEFDDFAAEFQRLKTSTDKDKEEHLGHLYDRME